MSRTFYMFKGFSVLLALFSLSFSTELRASPKYVAASTNGPIIRSVSRPQDSRGEPVYEKQGETQKDLPVVAGSYTDPSPIKLPKPKYPKSMKNQLATGKVTVEGIVAQNGELIDVQIVDATDPDFTQTALGVVSRCRFKPATLDGKPIAVLMRLTIDFRAF